MFATRNENPTFTRRHSLLPDVAQGSCYLSITELACLPQMYRLPFIKSLSCLNLNFWFLAFAKLSSVFCAVPVTLAWSSLIRIYLSLTALDNASSQSLEELNFIFWMLNSHLSRLRVIPCAWKLYRIRRSLSSRSCWELAQMSTSPMLPSTFLRPQRNCNIFFWKHFEADDIPKGSLLNLSLSKGAMKVVTARDSSASFNCQKLDWRLSLKNSVLRKVVRKCVLLQAVGQLFQRICSVRSGLQMFVLLRWVSSRSAPFSWLFDGLNDSHFDHFFELRFGLAEKQNGHSPMCHQCQEFSVRSQFDPVGDLDVAQPRR